MLERLRQWLSKPRGVEATEPPRPDLTAEERQLADQQLGADEEPGVETHTARPDQPQR
jgi:hypothetical protein